MSYGSPWMPDPIVMTQPMFPDRAIEDIKRGLRENVNENKNRWYICRVHDTCSSGNTDITDNGRICVIQSVGRLLRPVRRSVALLEGRWLQPRAWLGLPDSWGTPGRAADPGQGARERVSKKQHQAQEQAWLDPALEHARRRPGHSSPHAQGSKIAEPLRSATLPAGPPIKAFSSLTTGTQTDMNTQISGWAQGKNCGIGLKEGICRVHDTCSSGNTDITDNGRICVIQSVGRLLRPVRRSVALLEGRWLQPRAWLGLPDSWGTPGRAADPGQGARERVSKKQHQAQEQAWLDPALEHARRRPGHSSPHAQGSKIAEPLRSATLPAGPPIKAFSSLTTGTQTDMNTQISGWAQGKNCGIGLKEGDYS
eukprot:bmy_20137T0